MKGCLWFLGILLMLGVLGVLWLRVESKAEADRTWRDLKRLASTSEGAPGWSGTEEAKLIEEKFDRFRDTSTLGRTEAVKITDEVSARIGVAAKNGQWKNASVTMYWSRTGDDWEWLKYHPVIMMVDGEKWPLGTLDVASDSDVWKTATGALCHESLYWSLSHVQVRKLTAADSVEVKIGTTEFVLDDRQRTQLREVLVAWLEKLSQLR